MSLEISTRANADSNYNYDIFLSHSGHQKLFVHYLYRELQYASYKTFFDQDNGISLPKGSHLLLEIMNAIKSCKLAVVVISEGFITSLWPMMELQHLMAATHECIIYPVFYEIQPGDLVKEKKLKKWNKRWKDLAKKNQNQAVPIDISTWSQSLASLKLLAGTIITVAASQQILFEKIFEIVKNVCQKILPPLFYHDPLIKGKERTVQAIQDSYKRILENCTEVGVLVLGVAGIAGSGKTTICKTMVDYYNQHEFLGNSVLVELPTEEVQKEQIIQKFKIVVETITRAQKLTMERITHIEQDYFLFSQVKRDYFIAIDNVCKWSAGYVTQILQKVLTNASYVTHKPKVMITSHSKPLLKKIGVRTVINVPPVLNKEEALDVLLSYGGCWELYKSSQVEYKIQIESILNICYMNIHGFHPLLLKTLGNIMCQTVGKDGYGWEECIHEMRSICIGLTEHQSGTTSLFQSEIEKAIINALEANYSHLDDHLKKLFIDIAILYPRCINNLQDQLSMLKDYQDMTKVILQVNRLEYFGLWSVRRGLNNQIEIHDLYKALAKKEAKINGSFLVFLDGEVTIAPLTSLSKVTRIVSYGMPHKRSINVGNLKGLHFKELLLDRLEILALDAKDIMILFDAWRYDNTTSATTFLLQYPFINLNNNMRRIIGKFYEWWNVDLQWRSDLCLRSLSILKLECGNSITRLDALGCALNLQSLTLSECYALKSIKGVEKLKRLKDLILGAGNLGNHSLRTAYLNGCLELKKLIIIGFNQVKSLADLHCPHGLERLELIRNRNLVDVGDIGCFGQNLVKIKIVYCNSLKEFPGVALPKLERLEVLGCEELEGAAVLCEQNFPCLKNLYFEGCPRLKAPLRILKAGGLTFLNSIGVLFNFFESTLGRDMTHLDVTVNREQFYMFSNAISKENITAISGLVNLQTLSMEVVDTSQAARECSNNSILSNLSFLSHLHGLEYLGLIGFDFIRSLEQLSCLTSLQTLRLQGCGSHVEELPLPPNLSVLTLEDCRSLRRLTTHDWSVLPLNELHVYHCPLEWFQDSFRTLPKINHLSLDYESCYGCSLIVAEDAYKVVLDLSNVEYFQELKLEDFPASSLSNLKWPKEIYYLCLQSVVSSCVAGSPGDDHGLQFDNCCIPSVSCIKCPPKLRILEFSFCNEVRSLADFSCPTSLEHLVINGCRDLEEAPDLSSLVNLSMISLSDCPSLERLPGYTPRTGLELRIKDCPRLKTATNLP